MEGPQPEDADATSVLREVPGSDLGWPRGFITSKELTSLPWGAGAVAALHFPHENGRAKPALVDPLRLGLLMFFRVSTWECHSPGGQQLALDTPARSYGSPAAGVGK